MYTIQLLESSTFVQQQLFNTLRDRVRDDGRFLIGATQWDTSTLTRKEKEEVGIEEWQVPTLRLQRIRLSTPKPYCGNHPGPCQVNGRKKPTATYLEWDDWVAFHALVNEVCDSLQLYANIWTLPQDAGGKFWIRKGFRPRLRYDYTEEYVSGRSLRVWNKGTTDQFQPEA